MSATGSIRLIDSAEHFLGPAASEVDDHVDGMLCEIRERNVDHMTARA